MVVSEQETVSGTECAVVRVFARRTTLFDLSWLSLPHLDVIDKTSFRYYCSALQRGLALHLGLVPSQRMLAVKHEVMGFFSSRRPEQLEEQLNSDTTVVRVIRSRFVRLVASRTLSL